MNAPPAACQVELPAASSPVKDATIEASVRDDDGGEESTHHGYFKDRQKLMLRVSLPLPSGAWRGAGAPQVTVSVQARCAHGGWSLWRLVETLPPAPLDGDGCAVLEWGLGDDDWTRFNRWVFADFRFVAQGDFSAGGKTRAVSDSWRHYASRVGIYGFGPIGERYSNSEIRLIAEQTGGAAIQFRQREALKKMAAQVAPDERGMRLYGYSLGGRAAVGLARWLGRRGVGVELLLGIDPVDLIARQIVVPANVRRAISCYQRNGARLPLLAGPAGRGLPFAAADAAKTLVENRRIDVTPGGWAVMHEDAPRVLSAEAAAMMGEG